MPEFYMFLARKIITILEFFIIFARKFPPSPTPMKKAGKLGYRKKFSVGVENCEWKLLRIARGSEFQNSWSGNSKTTEPKHADEGNKQQFRVR